MFHHERLTTLELSGYKLPLICASALAVNRILSLCALRSLWQLKRASLDASGDNDYWQASKSVAGIHAIEPAGEIVRRYAAAAHQA